MMQWMYNEVCFGGTYPEMPDNLDVRGPDSVMSSCVGKLALARVDLSLLGNTKPLFRRKVVVGIP